jgi:hypothetical protein
MLKMAAACDARGIAPMRQWVASALFFCALALATTARADFVIPAGGFVSLASGGLDLGCTDLIIGGTLQTNSAPVSNVRNLVIQGGGVLDAGSSLISVGGDWSNSGTFLAGTSQVNFIDACAGAAAISGNTTFNNVSYVSSVGKTWTFAAGSTQTVQQVLNIQGTTANPLQFRSSVPGQVAFIDLIGIQNIAHVGVTDMTATGVWLAPFLSNEGGGGNANRWFGVPDSARIPALSPAGLLVLLLLLGGVAAATVRQRRRG